MNGTVESSTSWRAVGLGLALAAAASGLTGWSLAVVLDGLQAREDAGPVSVDEGLVLLVALAVGLVAAAGGVLAVLGTLAVLPGRGAARTVRHRALCRAPRWAPRAAAALLCLSLASPAAATVPQATGGTVSEALTVDSPAEGEPPSDSTTPEDAQGAGVPLPGWTPSERAPQLTAAVSELVTAGSAPDRAVVVHRGDTLWAIAARHLGPDATAEEIAATWPRWHEANRSVIGDDPHLILPGQQLLPPHAHSEGTRP